MVRAVKKEYYYPGHGDALYYWGQEIQSRPGGSDYTGEQMPDWMVTIADGIRQQYDELVDHAIVIEYTDGTKHYAPPHHDKLPPNTGFYVYSFGTPRRFQFLGKPTGTKVVKEKGNDGNVVEKEKRVHLDSDVAWDCALPHNSLLVVTADANRDLWHAVPVDKNWEGKRYSLIFRTISAPAVQVCVLCLNNLSDIRLAY